MALLVNIVCQDCGHESDEVVAAGSVTPNVCSGCNSLAGARQRAMHLGGLKALTIEQRLERIEEWIYDYKPVHVPAPRL